MMINEQIRDREVRLIDEEGEQMGVVTLQVALKVAEERGLDLVKIAPQANPPVCKIMDYGKYRFDQSKREKEQRKNQTIVEMKEVQLSATIDTHDMEVKAKACNKFLQAGNKVKVSIRFRGRQAAHGEIGLDVMNAFLELVSDNAVVEKPAKQEGRNMYMFLAPKNK
ncbi:MAG: translation initiation factor IF-3 [Clostridia bacterium]|nr:translation initiation factor IF-3 [Clostridia bacterium]